MGTDIHMRAQRRVAVDQRGPEHDEWQDLPDGDLSSWDGADGRDYPLFARLADVRNYNLCEVPVRPGGYEWERDWDRAPRMFEPLFAGRGLPPGVTAESKYEGDDPDIGRCLVPWLGDHSYTWATFRELAEADWDVECRAAGYVRLDHYRAWVAGGRQGSPQSWCGDISGGGTVKLTETELQRLDVGEGPTEELARSSTGIIGAGPRNTYVVTSWPWRPLNPERSGFVAWVRSPEFAALVQRYGGDNLRLVIGFDS